MRKVPVIIAFLFALAIFLPLPAQAGGKKVVATILPLYIFTLNVAGERAEVSLLIPPGTDTHEFTLRPADLKALAAADLVVANGAGLDDHLTARFDGKRLVKATYGISLIYPERAPDPHVWLDPLLAAEEVKTIAAALSKLDPENSAYYKGNADSYIGRLNALHAEAVAGLSRLKGRYLITYHEAFGYFAARYGLRYYSLTGPGSEQPLPQRIRRVYDIAKAEGIPALFGEGRFQEEALSAVAKDLGAKVCRLSAMDSGEATKGYYEEAMRANLKSIALCLGEGAR